MSTVKDNLLTRKKYTPYCGSRNCITMPMTIFNGEQFRCSDCGWTSSFEKEFIDKVKEFNK